MRQAPTARRLLAVGALSIVATLSAATPANGDAGAGGAGFWVCSPDALGHCVRGDMTTTVYPTLVGVVVVDFTCVVSAYPTAVSTQLTTCSFNGVDAIPVPTTSPTPVIVQRGTAIVPNGGSYLACIAGAGQFAEPFLGPVVVSGSNCAFTPVIPTQ